MICEACGCECDVVTIDVGIGVYEYWGAPGCDVHYVTVSNCCEADVIDFDAPEAPSDDLIPESEVAR
jgi:hypothetical protein